MYQNLSSRSNVHIYENYDETEEITFFLNSEKLNAS